jgi:hypothetical protein
MVHVEMAERYFSLKRLLTPGVACLGGPNFDQDLVQTRLMQQGLILANTNNNTPTDTDTSSLDIWCENFNAGFSEHVLLRKMRHSNAIQRYIPASAALLRPPRTLDCQPLFLFVHSPHNRHAHNVAIPMACMAYKRAIGKEHQRPQDLVERNNDTTPYQLVDIQSPHWCLTRMYDHLENVTSIKSNRDNHSNSNNANEDKGPLFGKAPCVIPYHKTQLFVGHGSRLKVPSWGFATEKFNYRLDPLDEQLLLPFVVEPTTRRSNQYDYYEKPCELYSKALLQEVPRENRKVDHRPIQQGGVVT